MSDVEAEKIRDEMRAFVEIIFEQWQIDKSRKEQSHKQRLSASPLENKLAAPLGGQTQIPRSDLSFVNEEPRLVIRNNLIKVLS